MNSAQNVVESFTQSLSGSDVANRRSVRFQEAAKLNAVAAFPSSFGLRVEAQNASLFINPAVSEALRCLVAILLYAGDQTATETPLHGLTSKSILYFRAFVAALSKCELDFSLQLGIPGSYEVEAANLTKVQISKLVRVFDVEAKHSVDVVDFVGRLIGFSLRTKYFMLENDDGTISGRISEVCIPAVMGKTVGATYHAKISILTEVNEFTGEESER